MFLCNLVSANSTIIFRRCNFQRVQRNSTDMKHIISIGINNTDGLTVLGAAVAGAKDFDIWGKSQGYTSTLLVDDEKSITQSQIFDEINKIVTARNCETLIVFFSGHGILKSPSQEVWLLSNAKNNPNESINLTASIDNARTSGIPYIVFISDACRVLPNELQFTGNGSVIFPICDDTNQDCAIDVLYATRPGNPALEQNSAMNVNKFGLFTQTLLEVLNGNYPELIKAKSSGDSLVNYYDLDNLNSDVNYKKLSNGAWQIDIINSEELIKSVVAQKARKINISLNQNPDIRIQYQNPKPFLSQFDDQLAKTLLLSQKAPAKIEKLKESFSIESVQNEWEKSQSPMRGDDSIFKSVTNSINKPPSGPLNVNKNKSTLVRNSQKILRAKGRGSFETQTGFTVIGITVKDMIVNGNKDVFSEDNLVHIRIYPQDDVRSGLLILEDDRSIPVAILEGYIGTLVFDNNQLLTINYTPSFYSAKYKSFEDNEENIEYARAFVASAANEGFDYSTTFENEFDESGTLNFSNAGSYLRHQTSIDPSLGLYAAYAFRQDGKIKDVKSVYESMKAESDTIIFDVAMLASMMNDTSQKLAPFCPMIALGWAYRQQFEENLNPLIIEAANHLIPSLWTTFNAEGTAILKRLFNENQII